jgi:GT2 family glycosyltransferase/glycosyltransferase involved in cell wall biosynthesis
MSEPHGSIAGTLNKRQASDSWSRIAPLVASDRAPPRQLIGLIQAGVDLASAEVRQLVDEVDALVLRGEIDRMAVVFAIGEALLIRAASPVCTPHLRRYLNSLLLNAGSNVVNRRRVLIMDFDFFSTVGGGQTFYRRLIERHPETVFFYPSTDPDIIKLAQNELPPNARPFSFNPEAEVAQANWVDGRLIGVLAAAQGMHFHIVDIPSFYPIAHLSRTLMSAWGVTADKIVVGMMGWLSESVRRAYEHELSPDAINGLVAAESAGVDAADARYAISELEVVENPRGLLPIVKLDFENALESFDLPDSSPPGDGLPDVWYVGRLDRAKGPDLFIELMATIPTQLYGRCFIAGPDNTWSRELRWSRHLLDIAASRGIKVCYEGVLSDKEIRTRVYRGRNVIVVPSRVDAFNYVALEAILNGCPVLLSDRTGAHRFLTERFPHLLQATMSPDDQEAAACSLRQLLQNYQAIAERCRAILRTKDVPRPRLNFMDTVYNSTSMRSSRSVEEAERNSLAACKQVPLLGREASTARPVRVTRLWPRVSVIIPTFNRPHFLGPTLASLLRQTFDRVEVVVVDDGSEDEAQVRAVVNAFRPMSRYLRVERRGEAGAANCGIELAMGEFVAFLSDDDAFAPELLAHSVELLESNPDAIGCYPDWNIVSTSGYFIEAHKVPDFDRRLMLCAHWCLPGPGTVIRRSVVRHIGGKDGRFRQVGDFDLWLRATKFGPMIHIPRTLAYWRLHPTNATSSDQGLARAHERLKLVEKFFSNPSEQTWSQADRDRAFAAAHLAAAAIAGRANPDAALRYLKRAAELDSSLVSELPPNMQGYPMLWPVGYEAIFRRNEVRLSEDSPLAEVG